VTQERDAAATNCVWLNEQVTKAQERAERAEARKDVWHERFEAVAEEARALQEEVERLGKMVSELNDAQVVQEKALLAIRDSKHAVPPVDASECRAIARNALSPTQETAPG
jgi:predicted  nucleic acid-binding Zn-ribbon protein